MKPTRVPRRIDQREARQCSRVGKAGPTSIAFCEAVSRQVARTSPTPKMATAMMTKSMPSISQSWSKV